MIQVSMIFWHKAKLPNTWHRPSSDTVQDRLTDWLDSVKLDQMHAADNNKDCIISGRKLYKIRDKQVKLTVSFFVIHTVNKKVNK